MDRLINMESSSIFNELQNATPFFGQGEEDQGRSEALTALDLMKNQLQVLHEQLSRSEVRIVHCIMPMDPSLYGTGIGVFDREYVVHQARNIGLDQMVSHASAVQQACMTP